MLSAKQQPENKVGTNCSNWQDILAVDRQGSILGPILFNISLCDLFLDQGINFFTNYAYETTPYIVGDNLTDVISSLTKIPQELFTWFANNQMNANHDKYHLRLSSRDGDSIQIANVAIKMFYF